MARVPWRPARISEVTLANLRRRGVSRDAADPARRLMLPITNNLAGDHSAGPSYSIKSESGQPTIQWSAVPTTIDADSAFRGATGRPRSERDVVVEWLKEKLAAGPLPARQIQDEAEAHGIRHRILRRAFRELDGGALRLNLGPHEGWLWRLPSTTT